MQTTKTKKMTPSYKLLNIRQNKMCNGSVTSVATKEKFGWKVGKVVTLSVTKSGCFAFGQRVHKIKSFCEFQFLKNMEKSGSIIFEMKMTKIIHKQNFNTDESNNMECHKIAEINNQVITAFVDFGSQCNTIKNLKIYLCALNTDTVDQWWNLSVLQNPK